MYSGHTYAAYNIMVICMEKAIKIISIYDEQGGDFKVLLATALAKSKYIQRQAVIEQKEETPNAE